MFEAALVVGGVALFGAIFRAIGAPERRFRAIVERLRDPAQADRAADDLVRHVAKLTGGYKLGAAAELLRVGRARMAVELLETMPVELRYTPLRAALLAQAKLDLGDLAGARTILERAPKSLGRPLYNRMQRVIEARIAVYEGDPERALAKLARLKPVAANGAADAETGQGDASAMDLVRLEAMLVRAHAHAALGNSNAAIDELRAVAAHSEDLVRATAHGTAPAASLAGTLVDDTHSASPYR